MVTQSSKVNRKDWNGKMTQKLGLGFGSTKKAYFVCGSYDHLIKDCDFHEKRMAKKSVLQILNTRVSKEKVNIVRVNGVNTAGQKAVSTVKGNGVTAVKASADSSQQWLGSSEKHDLLFLCQGNHNNFKVQRKFDSGCPGLYDKEQSLTIHDYHDIDGGFVAFGGSTRGGKITGIGKIRTNKIDFEDVFFVKELKFNLFSVSQMCDKKNSVLFTETECLVLSPDFKLIDESQVLLRVPRQNNMYSFDLKNVVPSGDLTCLFAKATIDESKLWHRRLGHVNFKIMNKLVKGNLVLVTKPHNKTPYELIIGRPPSISFMRPFGRPITNLNTLDPLGKFDGKAEEGFLVGYSVNSKAFRVFNSQTRKVEENLHVNILGNKPNVAGQGPNWIFDIDSLTISMKYQPVTVGNQTNKNAGPQEANGNTYLKQSVDAGQSKEKNSSDEKYKNDTADDAAGVTSIQKPASENEQALKNVLDKIMDQEKEATKQSDVVRKEFEAQCNKELLQGKATRASSTNSFNTVRTPVNAASAPRTFNDARPSFVPLGGSFPLDVNDPPDDPLMPDLEDAAEVQHTGIFGSAYDDDDDLDTCNSPYIDQGVGAEADFSPITTTRVHSIHPKDQIIGDPRLAVQTKGMTKKSSGEHATISYEPTKIDQALDDESWVEAMQEELLQFKIQKLWTLVNLPYGKKAIGTKIEAIMLFLAYASFMNFLVYQMDVKSAFFYGTIKEEVYVIQPQGFVDPEFPEKDNGFYRRQIDKTLLKKKVKGDILLISLMGELTFFLGLQVKQKEDGIFIRNDKYVGEILKKFGFSSIRTANTPMETNKALTKDEDGEDVDVYLYSVKKQTVVANSTTEAEYIAASQCCGQVLWIQNQLLDYGYNFMQTKIQVDNESVICVIKNLVYHSKTKLIEIRHHFIRDSYDKRLIEMVKIHTDNNVADLLTKAFDFWNNATSKTVNSLKQMHAIVDDKAVVISKSSVRNDLLFNDEDDGGGEVYNFGSQGEEKKEEMRFENGEVKGYACVGK
ncbi:ribonuclease H-like domain-containing protein [Tanacetum coccineum]